MSMLLLLAMSKTIFCNKKWLEPLKDKLWGRHILPREQRQGSESNNRTGQSKWLPIPIPLWGGSQGPSRAARKPAEMQHLFALPMSQLESSDTGLCYTMKFSQTSDVDDYWNHWREGGLCGHCFRTQEEQEGCKGLGGMQKVSKLSWWMGEQPCPLTVCHLGSWWLGVPFWSFRGTLLEFECC